MTNTTRENIDLARKIATAIDVAFVFEKIEAEAYIDDWGRNNNFAMLISFEPKDFQIDLRKVINIAKKIVKEQGGTWRSHETPKRLYDVQVVRGYVVGRYQKGFERNYIYVDLDINTVYHPETNSFTENFGHEEELEKTDIFGNENQLELF